LVGTVDLGQLEAAQNHHSVIFQWQDQTIGSAGPHRFKGRKEKIHKNFI
jgi:hypothetical protein